MSAVDKETQPRKMRQCFMSQSFRAVPLFVVLGLLSDIMSFDPDCSGCEIASRQLVFPLTQEASTSTPQCHWNVLTTPQHVSCPSCDLTMSHNVAAYCRPTRLATFVAYPSLSRLGVSVRLISVPTGCLWTKLLQSSGTSFVVVHYSKLRSLTDTARDLHDRPSHLAATGGLLDQARHTQARDFGCLSPVA